MLPRMQCSVQLRAAEAPGVDAKTADSWALSQTPQEGSLGVWPGIQCLPSTPGASHGLKSLRAIVLRVKLSTQTDHCNKK